MEILYEMFNFLLIDLFIFFMFFSSMRGNNTVIVVPTSF